MAEEDKAAEAPPRMNGADSPLVLKLRKSVIANGDEVNELTFREPTAGDIERAGNPVLIDPFAQPGQDMPYRFDAKSMVMMMSMLAAVPPSTIRQMHPNDFIAGEWLLFRFFS